MYVPGKYASLEHRDMTIKPIHHIKTNERAGGLLRSIYFPNGHGSSHFYVQYVAKSIGARKKSLYNQPKPYFFKKLL